MNIYLELFGYIGTALVLLSMMMTSLVKLRWFNMAGSVISMIYAAISNTWPVVFLNFGLIIINVIQLLKLRNTSVNFTYVPISAEDLSLKYYLSYYLDDIRLFFPNFTGIPASEDQCHMVYAGAEPVGIMLAQAHGTVLDVTLDYAAPKYRDCAVATFLFKELQKQGITQLRVHKPTQVHSDYLTKMGFVKNGQTWVKHYH